MTRPPRILIVAEDETERQLARATLEERGFAIATPVDGAAAGEELTRASFELVVISLAGVSNGLRLIEQIRSRPDLARMPVLVFAEWGTGQATLALSAGANAYEAGPIEAERLRDAVTRLLGHRAAVVE